MGQSPQTDIFFGFLLTRDYDREMSEAEEVARDAISEGEWGAFYLRQKGIPASRQHWEDDQASEVSGCIIESHGYDGDPEYFVAVKASRLNGDWESPLVLDPSHFTIQTEWIEKLRDFCQTMHLPWSEPKWYSVSSMGI